MTRSVLFLPLLFICVLLSACQTGSGYGAKNWDYNRGTPQPAQNPPRPLSEIYQGNAPSASARTGVDLNQHPQTAQQAPVKIALLLPLSGKHKSLGDSMLKAAQIALFDVGQTNFELIPGDTQGTPNGARNAAQSAVNNGAQIILGPVFAESVRAVKPIIASARINMIAFSTDWTLADNSTFILGFLPFDQVERVTRYAANNNITRIGLIAPSTSYGQAVTSAYDRITPRYGIQTTARTSFPANTPNLSPTVRQFINHDARQNAPGAPPPFEAILMPVGGGQASAISNLLSHYDLPPSRVKRLGTGLLDDKSLAAEPSLNGTWFAAPSPRLRRDFEQKFLASYGYSAPRLSTLAYDATALAAVLAKRGQQRGAGPDFNRAAIANPNGFFGIDGIFRFRPNGTAERGLAILEFNRSQIKEIDPAPNTFEQNNL